MAVTKGRGSDKLVANMSASQARLVLAAIKGWKVHDWFPLGKPSIDVLHGGITGRPSQVSSVVARLLRTGAIRDVNVLIKGTPRPEIADIRFTMRFKGR